eukprot:TRINITY_DN12518_c0_g1_i3.p1 TRINITY_DN12518_c0_g1~~TRINITY_DN12518_c0_g1_i3.p1  ORF type:complete len:571 (-),score=141.02 TRINITY_DN12518_c0_g1_i3:1695-3407(-)
MGCAASEPQDNMEEVSEEARDNKRKCMLEGEELANAFELASHYVSGQDDMSTDQQLEFYGLFKQSTAGQCSVDKPSDFDVKRTYKWKAWNKHGDMPQEDAMREYVATVVSMAGPGWLEQAQAAQGAAAEQALASPEPGRPGVPESPMVNTPAKNGQTPSRGLGGHCLSIGEADIDDCDTPRHKRMRAGSIVGELLDPDQPVPPYPLPLPDALEWSTMDLGAEEQLDEVFILLRDHYVENTGGEFRIYYSKEFLKWDMGPVHTVPEWCLGVRQKADNKLVGFLSGIPVELKVYDEGPGTCAEINFFCIHFDWRKCSHAGISLARLMITEMTRRVYNHGTRIALYTGGQELPNVITRCRYFHRKINCRKLVDCGFSYLPRGMTIEELEEKYELPEEPGLGLRSLELRDIPRCLELLNEHNEKYNLQFYRSFSEEELAHTLMSSDPGIVYSYVLETDGVVTDFTSFYCVPSTILKTSPDNPNGPKEIVGEIKNGYMYYTAVTTVSEEDMLASLLVVGKKENFDVFTVLGCYGLKDKITDDQCKFGRGTGILKYYLYNWQGPTMDDTEMGFLAL